MINEENVVLKMSMFRNIESRGEFAIEAVQKSDEAIVTYTALRIIYNYTLSEQTTTVKELLKVLGFDTTKPLQRESNRIKNGLQILNDNGVISYTKKGNKYIIDTTNLFLNMKRGGDLTFSIPVDYIHILATQKNCFPLIRHYLTLCSTINVMGKHFGTMSIDNFTELLNMSEKTIRNQRNKFEELGLIKFSTDRHAVGSNGEFINIPKKYAMPYSKVEIDELANEALEKARNEFEKTLRRQKKERLKAEREAKKRKPTENNTTTFNPFGDGLKPFDIEDSYETKKLPF